MRQGRSRSPARVAPAQPSLFPKSDIAERRLKLLIELKQHRVGDYRGALGKAPSTPARLSIGIFGPYGQGKSSLINSINRIFHQEDYHGLMRIIAPIAGDLNFGTVNYRCYPNATPTVTLYDSRGLVFINTHSQDEVLRYFRGEGCLGYVTRPAHEITHFSPDLVRRWSTQYENNKATEPLHASIICIGVNYPRKDDPDMRELLQILRLNTPAHPIVAITKTEGRSDDQVREEFARRFSVHPNYVFPVINYVDEKSPRDPLIELKLLQVLQAAIIQAEAGLDYQLHFSVKRLLLPYVQDRRLWAALALLLLAVVFMWIGAIFFGRPKTLTTEKLHGY